MSTSSTQSASATVAATQSANGSRHSQPKRWWRWLVPRFSLRSLLICITLACCTLGLWISRAERQRVACEQLTKLGWTWQFQEDVSRNDPGPKWFRRIPRVLREGEAAHYWRSVDIARSSDNHVTLGINVVSRLPSLRKLVISDRLEPLHAEDWKKLAQLTSLQSLSLSKTAIDDAGMADIAQLRNLTSLDLSETIVGNEGAKYLARMSLLEDLDLSETNIGDNGLPALAGLTSLKSLNLNSTRVTGAGLKHLAGLESLKTFSASRTRIDDRIGVIVAGMARLETFVANDIELTDATGATMFTSPELETICLDGAKVGSRTIAAVATLPKLKVLDLTSAALKPGDVLLLKNAKALEKVWLPLGASIEEVVTLRHLPKLSEVMVGTQELRKEHLAALDGVCDGGGSLEFFLSRCRLGREGWAKLAASRNVVELHAEHSDLDDEGLAKLAAIPTLRELWLEGCPITDAGLAAISKCKSLSTLELSSCPITDEGLRHLSSLEFLEALLLNDCRGVTDAGLSHLAPIQISALHLAGTLVTNAGLREFPSPHELHLDRTAVTMEGLFGLKQRQRLRFVDLTDTTFDSREMPLLTSSKMPPDMDDVFVRAEFPFAQVREKLRPCEHAVRSLNLHGQSLTNDDIATLSRMVQLKDLTLSETQLAPSVWRWIGEQTTLTSLDIGDVPISDEALDSLCRSRILNLKINNTTIGVEQLRKLIAVPSVLQISLVDCPLTEEHLDILAAAGEKLDGLELTRTGLAAEAMRKRLSSFVSIASLIWDGHYLSPQQIKWMVAMQKEDPNLVAVIQRSMLREAPATSKSFGFICCWSGPNYKELTATSSLVTDQLASRYLAEGRDAQEVDLKGSEIGHATMRELAQFPWLISLDVSDSTLCDEHFQGKKEWTQLRTFVAQNCALGDEAIEQLADCWRLTSVNLDQTGVTDRALRTLGQFRLLESLQLSGTNVTDDGLQSLYGLKHLELLWLDGSLVTPEGVEDLRKRLPNCQIFAGSEVGDGTWIARIR